MGDSSGAPNDHQASMIIKLWNNLSGYDRKPFNISSSSSTKLVEGGFKADKKSTVVPGLDSTRCLLGQNSGLATWPNCNRYMEAVHIKWCQIYPSSVKKNDNTTLQWTLVGNAHKKIRESVMNNDTSCCVGLVNSYSLKQILYLWAMITP